MHVDPDRPVRSFFSFGVGLVLTGLGLAVVVADSSPLSLAETGSVATLGCGLALFITLVRVNRGNPKLP